MKSAAHDVDVAKNSDDIRKLERDLENGGAVFVCFGDSKPKGLLKVS